MRANKFFKRLQPGQSTDRLNPDRDRPAPRVDGSWEGFESLPEYKPIITAARAAEPLPVPGSFAETVMRQIPARASGSPALTVRVRKWTRAGSKRELGHCFLVTGFFYFVLASVMFLGLQALPAAAWMRWQPAGGLIAALLFGSLGVWLISDEVASMRIAEIGACGSLTALAVTAAGTAGTQASAYEVAATIFFLLITCGPSLFLLATVHQYRTRSSSSASKRHGNSEIDGSTA